MGDLQGPPNVKKPGFVLPTVDEDCLSLKTFIINKIKVYYNINIVALQCYQFVKKIASYDSKRPAGNQLVYFQSPFV